MSMPTRIVTTEKAPGEMANNQSCASGFQWNVQRQQCEDIDECGKCNGIIKNGTNIWQIFHSLFSFKSASVPT
jgi:hypothetical protein